MANQQGFSAAGGVGDLAKILAHFDRTKLYDDEGNLRYVPYPNLTQRGFDKNHNFSEIDPELTYLNYNLAPEHEGGQAAFIERRLSEVYCHKTALKNAIVDWVVSLPDMEQYKGREDEFFKLCYAWLAERYGEENVVSAYVHLDEANPHMHFVFVPVVPDPKHKQGFKLSKKAVNTCVELNPVTLEPKLGKDGKVKVNTASFSLAFHVELDRYIQEKMGVEQGGIRLTAEQLEKRIVKQNLATVRELKEIENRIRDAQGREERANAAAETAEQRLEGVRRAEQASPRELVRAQTDGAAAEDERREAEEATELDRRLRAAEQARANAQRRFLEAERGHRIEKARNEDVLDRCQRAFETCVAAFGRVVAAVADACAGAWGALPEGFRNPIEYAAAWLTDHMRGGVYATPGADELTAEQAGTLLRRRIPVAAPPEQAAQIADKTGAVCLVDEDFIVHASYADDELDGVCLQTWKTDKQALAEARKEVGAKAAADEQTAAHALADLAALCCPNEQRWQSTLVEWGFEVERPSDLGCVAISGRGDNIYYMLPERMGQLVAGGIAGPAEPEAVAGRLMEQVAERERHGTPRPEAAREVLALARECMGYANVLLFEAGASPAAGELAKTCKLWDYGMPPKERAADRDQLRSEMRRKARQKALLAARGGGYLRDSQIALLTDEERKQWEQERAARQSRSDDRRYYDEGSNHSSGANPQSRGRSR